MDGECHHIWRAVNVNIADYTSAFCTRARCSTCLLCLHRYCLEEGGDGVHAWRPEGWRRARPALPFVWRERQ
jgi:hypothetical protein